MKIGEILYRAVNTGLRYAYFQYEIIELRTSEGTEAYVARCENCSHSGAKCEVLIHKSKDGLRFVDMVNNEEERHWHIPTRDWFSERFHEKKSGAKKELQKHILKSLNDQLDKAKANVTSLEARINEAEAII